VDVFGYFRVPVGWLEILKRTMREIGDDDCAGLAAQLAFYFLLALFPALLFLVALVGYLPVQDVLPELVAALRTVAPPELVVLIQGQLELIAVGDRASLLTLGIAGALWSSSAAMVAIIDALNRAYDITEWRPWWKRRLLALALTTSLSVFVVLALTLVLVGPAAARAVADWVGLSPVVTIVWRIARWPAILASAVVGVDLVYYFAPNRRVRWALPTPGALVAMALWVLSSFGFKIYVTNFGHYTATYGAIGGAIVAMLWLYVSGLAILVGAELNGVIEQALRDYPVSSKFRSSGNST
jgi:membrane protein